VSYRAAQGFILSENTMTEPEFDARIKQIDKGYAGKREGAEAYRDQELARLFIECKWTQEKIAQEMGRTQPWVTYRLRFGRYLEIITRSYNSSRPTDSLTEYHFRKGWSTVAKEHPKETEAERFGRVAEWLEANPPLVGRSDKYGGVVKRQNIRPAIQEILSANKGFIGTQELYSRVKEMFPGTQHKQINNALQWMQKKPPPGMILDARHNGHSHRYRLVHRRRPGAPTASVDPQVAGEMAIDALPLIKECIEILKAPVVGRQQTLAIDQLWKVQQMLEHLLYAEPVV
jgi:hypothetical protein